MNNAGYNPPRITLKSAQLLFLCTAVVGVAISYKQLYLFHVALVLLAAIYFVLLVSGRLGRKSSQYPTSLHYFFYFMLAWFTASIAWAISTTYAFRYVFYLICGIGVSLVAISFSRNLQLQNKLFRIISIVFLVEIVFCLLETFTSFRLPISPYSEYVNYFGRESHPAPNVVLSQSSVFNPPTGFQWNPNNMAVTLAIVLPFFLFTRKWYIKSVGTLLIFILIYATGSRGTLLAIAFMMLIYAIFYIMKRNSKLFIAGASTLCFLVVGGIGIMSIDSEFSRNIQESARAFQRYVGLSSDLSPSYYDSIGIRLLLIKNGMEALRETNGWGVGGGGDVAIQEQMLSGPRLVETMHNFWIELLVNGGIIFTAIFLWWYGWLFFRLYKIAQKCGNDRIRYYAGASSLSLIGFAFAAVSASSAIYLLPMWLLYGFAVTTVNIYEQSKHYEATSFALLHKSH